MNGLYAVDLLPVEVLLENKIKENNNIEVLEGKCL